MDAVVQIINRANQRGGRMLSLVDLLEAKTLNLAQAAWLVGRIERGASFLVGANPGGAGKTTIMGALLGMLPAVPAVHLAGRGNSWRRAAPGDCVVAYEINTAPYEAYIWGSELVSFTRLGRQGCRIVSNLHADTLEEAHDQIVLQCGADPEGFLAFDLFLPISVSGFGARSRRVERIWAAADGEWQPADPVVEPGSREAEIAGFLEQSVAGGLRRIEQLRSAWLNRD